jgi:hypothetical protein
MHESESDFGLTEIDPKRWHPSEKAIIRPKLSDILASTRLKGSCGVDVERQSLKKAKHQGDANALKFT